MITVGVDYYPEHWDENIWEDDVRRMRECGFDTVRIGEFAWSRMEPRDNEFDFDWLDKIINLINAYGMKVILGTPTNCAPVWLYRKFPDTVSTDLAGNVKPIGIRGHRCIESENFRFYAARIINQMATRYAGKPGIYAWQIDNELESNHCTCAACTKKFRKYLKDKYGTVKNLNKTWGLDVWSGEFTDFSEIELTREKECFQGWYNPAYMLDREKFAAKSLADYISFQSDIIREKDKNAIITTNSCFCYHRPDYHLEFKELSYAGYDNYPPVNFPDDRETVYSNAYALDFVRGFKRKDFWIMEQLGGPMGGWGPTSPEPDPGMYKSYALQAVMHGASLVSFFRWRTAVTGAEMFCYGLLNHDNLDNDRLTEVKDFIDTVHKIPEITDTKIVSDVAILTSAEQYNSFNNQFHSDGFDYEGELKKIHSALTALSQNVDVIHEEADISGYKFVIAPAHVITNCVTVKNLTEFAEHGGTVLLTFRSGVKNENGNCIFGETLPTAFSEISGISIKRFDSCGKRQIKIKTLDNTEYKASVWCDVTEPVTAEVIATYTDGRYKNLPAATRNNYGSGKVYYIGTSPEKQAYKKLFGEILGDLKIKYEILPDNVERTVRTGKDFKIISYFNNTKEEKEVTINGRITRMSPLETKIFEETFGKEE